MSKIDISSRRHFLKAGALLSAPLAAVSVAAFANDGSKSRLAQLEDERAIRDLHRTWLRELNAEPHRREALAASSVGALAAEDEIHKLAAEDSGPMDEITISADGRNATGRHPCTVEVATPIAQTCTLAHMAHAQGSGFVHRTEASVLVVKYTKAAGTWKIARAEISTAKA